jgi:deazaflavin-dependent oxidoreductase (nitroreductase family)
MSSEGQFIRLETIGRRTGNPHTVLLRFVTYGNRVVVFPEINSKQDWVLNLKSNPKVRVHSGGRVLEGVAEPGRVRTLHDPVLSVFSRKYGERVVRGAYWGQTEYIQIDLGAQVSTESFHDLIYADLEAAFDGVAEDYDRHIFGNPVNVWLRNRSVGLMSSIFQRGDTVLEVGCGTGTETLNLARMGVRVIATDVSSKMLDVLRRKAAAAGLSDLVVPIHSRPSGIFDRLRGIGCTSVDGAYSTYGAVNTEPRLQEFFSTLHALLTTEARLILGVWNKYCLYEIAGYSLKANPRMAVARLRNPVPVGRSRFCVSTNAYSVSSLNTEIGPYFTLERAYGVGVFLPPSNLLRYLPPEPLLSYAKRFELRVGSRYPWNRIGDHFLGVYKKNA